MRRPAVTVVTGPGCWILAWLTGRDAGSVLSAPGRPGRWARTSYIGGSEGSRKITAGYGAADIAHQPIHAIRYARRWLTRLSTR
jgi:hypothetical protein